MSAKRDTKPAKQDEQTTSNLAASHPDSSPEQLEAMLDSPLFALPTELRLTAHTIETEADKKRAQYEHLVLEDEIEFASPQPSYSESGIRSSDNTAHQQPTSCSKAKLFEELLTLSRASVTTENKHAQSCDLIEKIIE